MMDAKRFRQVDNWVVPISEKSMGPKAGFAFKYRSEISQHGFHMPASLAIPQGYICDKQEFDSQQSAEEAVRLIRDNAPRQLLGNFVYVRSDARDECDPHRRGLHRSEIAYPRRDEASFCQCLGSILHVPMGLLVQEPVTCKVSERFRDNEESEPEQALTSQERSHPIICGAITTLPDDAALITLNDYTQGTWARKMPPLETIMVDLKTGGYLQHDQHLRYINPKQIPSSLFTELAALVRELSSNSRGWEAEFAVGNSPQKNAQFILQLSPVDLEYMVKNRPNSIPNSGSILRAREVIGFAKEVDLNGIIVLKGPSKYGGQLDLTDNELKQLRDLDATLGPYALYLMTPTFRQWDRGALALFENEIPHCRLMIAGVAPPWSYHLMVADHLRSNLSGRTTVVSGLISSSAFGELDTWAPWTIDEEEGVYVSHTPMQFSADQLTKKAALLVTDTSKLAPATKY